MESDAVKRPNQWLQLKNVIDRSYDYLSVAFDERLRTWLFVSFLVDVATIFGFYCLANLPSQLTYHGMLWIIQQGDPPKGFFLVMGQQVEGIVSFFNQFLAVFIGVDLLCVTLAIVLTIYIRLNHPPHRYCILWPLLRL